MATTSELANFLRARRLNPADVGLPDSGRRRTPGLRREEVAALAGVSIDYLIRLEQGRDSNPSPSVLAALAAALRLTEEERAHLGMLAARGHSKELCPSARPPMATVPATIATLLDRLGSTPSFVLGPTDDVLAWNPSWAALVASIGLLDGEAPNFTRYVFLDERARDALVDWVTVADEQVRHLRAAGTDWSWEPGYQAIVAELSTNAEFELRWSAHAIAARRCGTIRMHHPELGALRFDHEALLVGGVREQRLVTWLPGDEHTAAALEPTVLPRLRVVGR